MNVKTKSGGPATEQSQTPPPETDGSPNNADTPVPVPAPTPGVVKKVREISLIGNDLYAQTRSYLRVPLNGELDNNELQALSILHIKKSSTESAAELGTGSCSGIPCLKFPALHAHSGIGFLDYGANELQVISVQSTEDLKGNFRISLRDFRIFGPVGVMPVAASLGTVTGSTLRPLVSNLMPASSAVDSGNSPDSNFIGSWQEQIEIP